MIAALSLHTYPGACAYRVSSKLRLRHITAVYYTCGRPLGAIALIDGDQHLIFTKIQPRHSLSLPSSSHTRCLTRPSTGTSRLAAAGHCCLNSKPVPTMMHGKSLSLCIKPCSGRHFAVVSGVIHVKSVNIHPSSMPLEHVSG